jgi:hypothetical protein
MEISKKQLSLSQKISSLISQEISLERLEEAFKERDPEKIKIIVKP